MFPVDQPPALKLECGLELGLGLVDLEVAVVGILGDLDLELGLGI